MTIDEALHFRDQFRQARATALRDAEAFEEIVFVLERMGSFLTGKIQALGRYEAAISAVSLQSPLAAEIPDHQPEFHSEFKVLYNLVRQGRNDALHQGAFARYLTAHAVELSLVLEDG
jgi:hypothetical protein